MSQNCTVMAFRKRLRLRGFTDISIIKHGLFYHVSYVDPLSGQRLEFGIMENRMLHAYNRRVR